MSCGEKTTIEHRPGTRAATPPRHRPASGVAALAAAAAVALALAPAPARAHVRITTDLTWSEDVRPILRQHCMGCHSPGGAAPSYVDLRTYGSDSAPGARAWAAAIEEELLTGRMPPWQADHRFDEFANSRRLTKTELDTVIGWIRGGAPQGPRRDLPPPPEFEDGAWQLGAPDRVLEPTQAVTLAAGEREAERSFELPVELEADAWITGFEFRPQNPRAVYRMAAWILDPPEAEPEHLEVEIQVPYDPFRPEDAEEPTRMIELPRGEHFLGQWLRGDAPVLLPEGMGRRLRQGSTLRLVVEYRRDQNDAGAAVEDRSQLGLYLAQQADEVDLVLLSRRARDGAAAADQRWWKAEIRQRRKQGAPPPRALVEFDENVRLVSLAPDFGDGVEEVEVEVVYPDGRRAPILVIDDYDAKWPAGYQLRRPLELPRGTRLLVAGVQSDAVGAREARPFELEVSYALDDHLVLPPVQQASRPPQSEGGMLLGADLAGARGLLRSGPKSSAAPGEMAPVDPRAAAHMDHSPLHGGQFFMASNNYHHIEGALPRPGEFELYVYDDFKKPVDPRNFAGEVVFERFDQAESEWEETAYELEPGPPGAEFLHAAIPDAMPVEFFASVWLAGEKTRFDFYFEEPSRALDAAQLARYAAAGPHSHERPPLRVPETAAEVVAELVRRQEVLRELVGKGEWLLLHVPAFDAIDLAQGLLDQLDGLSARDRGTVRQAIGRTLQSAAELDRAGDLADEGRARQAFARFDEAVRTIAGAF